jgi:hypothetical protein
LNEHDVADRIERFAREQFAISPTDPRFGRDVDLFEGGYVDSLGVADMLEFFGARVGRGYLGRRAARRRLCHDRRDGPDDLLVARGGVKATRRQEQQDLAPSTLLLGTRRPSRGCEILAKRIRPLGVGYDVVGALRRGRYPGVPGVSRASR